MAGPLERVLYALRLRRRPALHRTRADVLGSVPVRNSVVDWVKEDTGEVSLVVPMDQKRWVRLLIRLFHLPDKRVVTLDQVGAFVWEQCDGKSTFEEIASGLVGQFRMTRREAEASLAQFFRVLGKRGFLGFIVPERARANRQKQRSRTARTGRRRGR
jgi:hypothetical protein